MGTLHLTFRQPQINIYVANVEATVAFYRDLFGLRETFRTPEHGEPIHAELRLDGLVLGFATIESARRLHGLAAGSGPPRAELVLWTDDVDAAYAALTEKGAHPMSPPHDFIGNLRAAWVADPDGNPIQIVMRRAAGPDGP